MRREGSYTFTCSPPSASKSRTPRCNIFVRHEWKIYGRRRHGGRGLKLTRSERIGTGPHADTRWRVAHAEQRGAGTPAFLIPFPRYFSAAESDVLKRQVRQIVQSQLNLDDFLP